METINKGFHLTDKHIADYKRTGFVLLKQFFSAEMIDYLRYRVNEELETPTDLYQKGFDKLHRVAKFRFQPLRRLRHHALGAAAPG